MSPRDREIQAAALVVRTDAKLLGIPSVRDGLIQDAVRIASGKMSMPTPGSFKGQEPENVTAMLAALKRAVAAVRAERGRCVR
ncbi:hypothetical protein [Methylobacterium sp. WL120]|uniref:hypothetical protein n=1 Tax=Methylobacterium sp. WL120 TaxID=2603887 RepID=UPI0011CBDD83|nr:hypothetical protein [Methylobacterium sp. WL120]TXM69617.1 hypothetical protein FV229_04550 [Methylobacterium sp. WL120]